MKIISILASITPCAGAAGGAWARFRLLFRSRRAGWAACLLALGLVAAIVPGIVLGQVAGQVQEFSGTLEAGESQFYRLADLEQGQTLYVFMEGTSGNLDPALGIAGASLDPETLEASYMAFIQQAIAEGQDPVLAAHASADAHFVAADDDGGGGLAAALAWTVAADGDYWLVVSSALSALGQGTFGDYRLLAGLDAPEVLSGEAAPTGDSLAVLDWEAAPPGEAVQEIAGSLSPGDVAHRFDLYPLRPGDTLYVWAEATSGNLRPTVIVRNFADKPLRTANVSGQGTQAVLEASFPDGERGAKLEISAQEGMDGDYRLLMGVNAPEILSGAAPPDGQPVVKAPIPVQIGLKLQQIVAVDEQNESFTVVASLQMEWTDPELAFSPESCNCVLKTYSLEGFSQFLADARDRWPAFTLYNQQGNRWTQNRVIVVQQDGHALYFERFSTSLQVDFDFRQYPFDQQVFAIHIDAIYPETVFYFTDLPGYGDMSADHGEDEFVIEEFETSVASRQASTQSTTSRFTFRFWGERHLNYYILQIFVPSLLIIAVSWVTFFLRDYGRRIEVASANLLIFIAFSFSLSGNYPRLGYMTLLDAIMVIIFVINALVVVYNVWLRRLEMDEKADLANRIDNVLDWVYPLAYVASGVVLYLAFF